MGLRLCFKGSGGCRLAVLDCRYSLLGVRLVWVGWVVGVGAGGSISATFLLWVLWAVVGFLGFLVVGFRPSSVVFSRTNFPSMFVNSFQVLHFSALKVICFFFLGLVRVGGGTELVGMGKNFWLILWVFLGVSSASKSSFFSSFLFRCGLLVRGSKLLNSLAILGLSIFGLVWWQGGWGVSIFGFG